MSKRERMLILGAAGRDFHTFNVCFRDDPNYEVVAFTAAQIPGIESRHYPASLSGPQLSERDSDFSRRRARRSDTQRIGPTSRVCL